MSAEQNRVVDQTRRLLQTVDDVTLEEFRAEDAHFERNSRLGRELLYLIANSEWCRRTTETVVLEKVRAVDTRIVVDVDLSYVDHEAFQADDGVVWLPLLVLPSALPTGPESGTGGRWWRRRPSPSPGPDKGDDGQYQPDPITFLEVDDAAGSRVPKVPQAEVHRWLAAALGEILVNLIAGRPQVAGIPTAGPLVDREQKILLAAAIRRLLPPGQAPALRERDHDTLPQGIREARRRLRRTLEFDLATAQESAVGRQPAGGQEAAPRPRPLLGSRIGEILDALIGTVLVVVAAAGPRHQLSYGVTVPSRRLRRSPGSAVRGRPRARVGIDLITPAAHADRLIRLVLPDGVVCLEDAEPQARTVAGIEVVLPGPFERLETLMRRLVPPAHPPGRTAGWVDGRLAELALHKVDAALECLHHYHVLRLGDGSVGDRETLTGVVDGRLRELRRHLDELRRGRPDSRPLDGLASCWHGGDWMPAQMSRRLTVNIASPGSVLIRATAVEDATQRARPTRARIDAEVAISDSPVFNVARFSGSMNLLVLAVLAVLLQLGRPLTDDTLPRDSLATVLTLFSAVQAGRVEHPDSSTLRGVLSRASYWLLIASLLPTVLLALAIVAAPVQDVRLAAWVAAAAQLVIFVRLRQGPLSFAARRGGSFFALGTDFAPDHARGDALRSPWCRALAAEAMLLGREAYAYVVSRPAGDGEFTAILDAVNRSPVRPEDRPAGLRGPAARVLEAARAAAGVSWPVRDAASGEGRVVNLLGAVQSSTAGRSLAFLVFRERPEKSWLLPERAEGADSVFAVPLDAERLAPAEPPEWVLEVLLGLPAGVPVLPLTGHPLLDVVAVVAEHNFRVQTVQLPAPPPPDAARHHPPHAPPYRWARLRVEITYRRGDSLRGLQSFLAALDAMQGQDRGNGPLCVMVQTLAGRPASANGAGTRVLTDRDFDVVPDEEAAGDPTPAWRGLALCGYVRTGLLRDLLAGLAVTRPDFRLAGLTSATVHGQLVLFLLGRELEAVPALLPNAEPRDGEPATAPVRDGEQRGAEQRGAEQRGTEPATARARPTGAALGAALAARLRVTDRVTVALDDRLPARVLDGAPVPDHLLLRVGLRSPDRPGVLPRTLDYLRQALAARAPAGVRVGGLDIWFVMLRIADGRSTRGRLTIRLPGGPAHRAAWEQVDWAGVERDVIRAGSLAARSVTVGSLATAWSSPLLDDVVVGVELLRGR